MSQTEHDQTAYHGEQERQRQERPGGAGAAGASLELLTLLAAGAADLALDHLRQTADRAQDALRRADLRELLTEGVVELRKRGELATRRAGMGNENYLDTMARRVAEQTTSEGRPCA